MSEVRSGSESLGDGRSEGNFGAFTGDRKFSDIGVFTKSILKELGTAMFSLSLEIFDSDLRTNEATCSIEESFSISLSDPICETILHNKFPTELLFDRRNYLLHLYFE